jgi:hypothetical protein
VRTIALTLALVLGFAAPLAAQERASVLFLASEADALALSGPLAVELGAFGLTVEVAPAPSAVTRDARIGEAAAAALVTGALAAVFLERDAEAVDVHVVTGSIARAARIPEVEPTLWARVTSTVVASLVLDVREGPLAPIPPAPATPPEAAPETAALLAEPQEAIVPAVSLYAQLGVGLLLREREANAEPTFTQRIAVGLVIDGTVRLGLTLSMPMFIETLELRGEGGGASSWSNSASYFGGVEVAYRARIDLLALHVGAAAAGGAGQLPVDGFGREIRETIIADVWVPAFLGGVFGAIGIAATGNTDLVLRLDLGGRVRAEGGHDFVGQLTLGVDWH